MDVDFAELSAAWGGDAELDLPAQFLFQQEDELMDAELMAFLTQPQPACIGLNLEPAVDIVRRTSSDCSDSASVPASSAAALMTDTTSAAPPGAAPRLVTTQVSCGPQTRKKVKATANGSAAAVSLHLPSAVSNLPPLPACAVALASGAVASSAAGSPASSPINPPPASMVNLAGLYQGSTLSSNPGGHLNPAAFGSSLKLSISPSASSLGSAPSGLHDMLQKLGAVGSAAQTSSQNSAGTGATATTTVSAPVKKQPPKKAAAANDDSSSEEEESEEEMDESETRSKGVKRPASEAAAARANKRKVPDVDWRAITDPAERRRQRRLAKNRVTAARSRDRKKVQWAELEGRLQAMESENSKLRTMLEAYASENTHLRVQLNNLTGNPSAAITTTQPTLSLLSGLSAGSGNSVHEPAVYVLIFTLLLVTCFLPGDEASAALTALGGALPLLAAAVALAQSLDPEAPGDGGGGFGKGAGNGTALFDMLCRLAAMAQMLVARSGRAARKSMRRLLFGAGFTSARYSSGGGSKGVVDTYVSPSATAAVTAGLMELDEDDGGGGGGRSGGGGAVTSLSGSSSNLLDWAGRHVVPLVQGVAAHCIKCEVMI